MSRREPRALLSLCILAAVWATPGAAQGLPPYAAMNPLAYGRSGLATLPYRERAPGWKLAALTDYANLIEYTDLSSGRLILDAEILRVELALSRDLGEQTFVFASSSLNGAYDGFLDGPLAWYHDLTGLQVAGRDERPRNRYLYDLAVTGGPSLAPPNPGEWLGDVRIGAGRRFTRHWQIAWWLTIPTGEGPDGFRRGVLTANALSTVRAHFAKAFVYEGSLGFGWAARHGVLRDLQRTTFVLFASGVRARIAGPMSLYGNLLYHSPYYRNAGLRALDSRDLTVDVGGIFRFGRGPEWILGLTEDLEPRGPAIDVSFRLGARW